MPIEIKELHIKAVITAPRESASRTEAHPLHDQDLQKLKHQLLEECVEKVFRRLEEKLER